MIRKLQHWWLSQLGRAVRVKYLPGSGAWKVEQRYGSFGPWYTSPWQAYPLESYGWTMNRDGNFANISDAMKCAEMARKEECIRHSDEHQARVISFISRKVRW